MSQYLLRYYDKFSIVGFECLRYFLICLDLLSHAKPNEMINGFRMTLPCSDDPLQRYPCEAWFSCRYLSASRLDRTCRRQRTRGRISPREGFCVPGPQLRPFFGLPPRSSCSSPCRRRSSPSLWGIRMRTLALDAAHGLEPGAPYLAVFFFLFPRCPKTRFAPI